VGGARTSCFRRVIGHSHAVIGACAGVVVAHLTHGDPLVGAVVGGIAGLAPDVDSPESTIGRRLPRWWHALTPGHRGVTHSLLWCAALAAAAYGAQWWLLGAPPASPLVGLAVLAGALSHLAADSMTDNGVPLLWPLTRRHLGLPWPFAFRTGSWPEHIVVLGVLGGAAWWTYSLGRVWAELAGRLP